jgi:hypothetical protein
MIENGRRMCLTFVCFDEGELCAIRREMERQTQSLKRRGKWGWEEDCAVQTANTWQ